MGTLLLGFEMLACVCAKSLQLCPTLFDPMDCSLTGSSVHGILQANTGVGCHFQGIFLTQGSNLGLLHCRQTLYHLSHQGSHVIIKAWIVLNHSVMSDSL